MELEIKHLQRLLIENNDKQEQQKKEIKELRDALENERTLFAEQLRARVAKETEARQAHESRSAEAALRERKELANKVTTLEQRLKDKERAESELKDENWRLVNLLKDNSVELVTEKESLQEQLEKQEDIIRVRCLNIIFSLIMLFPKGFGKVCMFQITINFYQMSIKLIQDKMLCGYILN